MRRFLLLLLLLLAVGGGVWYFYIRPKQAGTAPGVSSFRSFFSLGNNTTVNEGQLSDTTSDTIIPAPIPGSPFVQLSAGPTAGFTDFTITRTITIPAADPKQKPTKQVVTDHVIRYVSRANGYVYEITNDSVPIQISNIFIPNIYEAYFADNNQTVLLRFLRDDNQTIATYSVPIPELNSDGTRTQQEGVYLPDNIHSVAISPDQKFVARLTSDAANAIVTVSDSRGGGAKEVLRNSFHEWLLDWKNQLYVQTKASAIANGFLYRVDNKRLVRVTGTIPGLTASVSPKGTYVLYSESTQDGFNTRLLNTKTNALKNIGVSILPEKCTWLLNEDVICAGNDTVPTATYPDSWYQGLVSLTDKLYRISPSNGLIEQLNSGNDTGYDIIDPIFDESQDRLYFIDKKTGYLWKYSL